MKLAGLALCLAVTACGVEELPPGELVLDVGHETDAWTRAPAPSSLSLDKRSLSDEIRHVSTVKAPARYVKLDQGGVGRYTVTGSDASNVPVLRGRSLFVDAAGFSGARLPLFVARVGELARPPGELPEGELNDAPAVLLDGRSLVIAGDAALPLAGYDFGLWTPLQFTAGIGCAEASCPVRSLAIIPGGIGLALGDTFASWFDLAYGSFGTAPLPDGLTSYASVVGACSVEDEDGNRWLAGGTRPGAPSADIVTIASDGTLGHALAASPRAGAATTWLTGRGLFIAGGSETGAGLEVLEAGAKTGTVVPYPADPTTGAALVALDDSTLLRIGGYAGAVAAPTVKLALGCGTCAPEPTAPAAELDRASAYLLEGGDIVVVGRDATGETRVRRLHDATFSDVPLREPRRGATSLWSGTGHVVIAGGTGLDGRAARAVELLTD